ncbi:MAG: IS66 family transposase [Streptosporangiaceae bacterium]
MPGTPDADELRAENARLRDQVERLGLLNEDKDAVIAELRAQNAELAEKMARLERLISRNSGNSSMPPSSDDRPGKKPPRPRQRQGGRKRKPGKQPGAPGAYLPWNDHPDDTIPRFPEGACGCGRDLAGAADLGVRYSHQVTDLPEARAETIQHDRHEVQCACGRRHVADAPPEAAGAPGTVTYGLNFQAWCVFLMVMHHVPVERCADILESMSGTRPSDGWVHGLLARAAGAVAAANKTIRALIILARVVCGDETPIRAGPGPGTAKKKYLQVACTNLLTYYFLGDRDLPSFKDFVYSDLHGTVIVHDRYACYDHFTGISHQLCTAHLLRDIEDAAQSYPGEHWPAQIARELRALIHQANAARDQGLATVPDEAAAEHLRLFRNGVNVGLAQVSRIPGAKARQPPARLLLECPKHREADVLRFLTDTAIPATSNQAERDLRPAKTQQKISGRLRSEPATRDRCAIRGYASTAAKHGIAIFTAIYDALAGNAWIPPIPADA